MRGLLVVGYDERATTRIIPARAGFTAKKATPIYVAEDHPRACGVYSRIADTSPATVGSSPRVRGLLLEIRRRDLDRGIIPARAGFTLLTVTEPI